MNSNADNPMDWSDDENISDSATNAMRGKVTLVAIAFLFFTLAVMTFFYLYDRRRLSRSMTRDHHIRNRHRRATMVFFFPADPSQTASTGLDPSVVISLPVFTFSSSDAAHRELIDCAVCLSEFEEGESGRVLPGCKHAFHVECIDMWFHSHSTCPLCRSLVEPPEPVYAAEPGFGSSAMMPLEDLGRNQTAIDVPGRV